MSYETLCRTCRFLSGCPLLVKGHEGFQEERLSTDERPRFCPRWEPTGYREATMRLRLLEEIGIGGLRAVHTIPKQEITEQEDEVTVDFLKMAGDGVTHSERAAQLRYETDEKGEILLDEEGNKRPRLSYDLRKYATDPKGPIKAKETQVLFWTQSQLVNEILAAEKQAGVIVTPQEKKKLTKGAASGAPNKTKEDNVGKIQVKRTGGISLPGKSGGAAGIRFPITNKQVDDPEPEEPEAPEEPQEEVQEVQETKKPKPKPRGGGKTPSKAAAAAPALDAKELAMAMLPVIQEELQKGLEALNEELRGQIESAKAEIMKSLEESQSMSTAAVTILHDVLAPVVTGEADRQLLPDNDIFLYLQAVGGEGNGG